MHPKQAQHHRPPFRALPVSAPFAITARQPEKTPSYFFSIVIFEGVRMRAKHAEFDPHQARVLLDPKPGLKGDFRASGMGMVAVLPLRVW